MYFIFIILIISFSSLSAQTLQRNWGVEYKDTVQKVYGRQIASDINGNVCISVDSDSSYMYMIKYTKNGEIEWNKSAYYLPELFRRRRPNGFGKLEYLVDKDVYHLTSMLQRNFNSLDGTLLSIFYENGNGVSHGFYPSENSSSLFLPSIVVRFNENLFIDSKIFYSSLLKETTVQINLYDKYSTKINVDTVKILDSTLVTYSLFDTKIDRTNNSIYHLIGYNIENVRPSMFLLSKSNLLSVEDTLNSFIENSVFMFTSNDLGVPTHLLLVRKLLIKDDKIYVCGMSLSKSRMYHPFVATINNNGELQSVDFPFGTEGSTLPRDFCFSSDSSAIILAGENYDLINNSIFRPTVKGYSLVTKDTFSFDENDRLGRFLAVTATSNGTIVATGLDLTGGPDYYMYTASYSGIPLSVQENNAKTQITVVPNPTTGMIRLHVPESVNGTLTISNIYGQELLKLNDYQTSTSIDVSRLSSGFYFLSYGEKEKLTSSFVLTK